MNRQERSNNRFAPEQRSYDQRHKIDFLQRLQTSDAGTCHDLHGVGASSKEKRGGSSTLANFKPAKKCLRSQGHVSELRVTSKAGQLRTKHPNRLDGLMRQIQTVTADQCHQHAGMSDATSRDKPKDVRSMTGQTDPVEAFTNAVGLNCHTSTNQKSKNCSGAASMPLRDTIGVCSAPAGNNRAKPGGSFHHTAGQAVHEQTVGKKSIGVESIPGKDYRDPPVNGPATEMPASIEETYFSMSGKDVSRQKKNRNAPGDKRKRNKMTPQKNETESLFHLEQFPMKSRNVFIDLGRLRIRKAGRAPRDDGIVKIGPGGGGLPPDRPVSDNHREQGPAIAIGHELVNNLRIKLLLPPYERSYRLDNLARIHARRLAGKGKLLHSVPSPPALHLQRKLGSNCVGENIMRGPSITKMHEAVTHGTSEHWGNLLARQFTQFGIGACRSDRDGKLYVCQFFSG